MDWLPSATRWLLDSEQGAVDRLIPRWLFLRALGLYLFVRFFSLVFQIRGSSDRKEFFPQTNTCKP